MRQEEYDDARAVVESGNVVEWAGRTAHDVEGLDFIRAAEENEGERPLTADDAHRVIDDLSTKATMAERSQGDRTEAAKEEDAARLKTARKKVGDSPAAPSGPDTVTIPSPTSETDAKAQAFTPDYVAETSPPGRSATAVTGDTEDASNPADGEQSAATDDTTDGRGYTKPALLKIAGERGITVPSGATKADIVALIESQGGAPTTAETEVSTK